MKTLLATPTLSGASDSDSITLSWAAIAGAASYELELDGVVINVGDVTTYIHAGLNVGTQHSYKLRALSEDNNSLWTAALTRWTLPSTPVISQAVSSASSSITVQWTAVTGTSGYDVEINGAVSGTSNTTLTRTGLTANTEYTVRVRSKNAGGVGEWSQPVVVKTLLTTPVLSGASSSDAITLNWSAIAGATSYELELDGTVIAVGDEVSYTHSGLAAGTQHNYKLRALSEDNASLWTAALTRWTIPGMPVISEAVSNTSTAITVKWASVAGTNGYDVEINGAVSSNTSTTLNKTGLTTNTDYTVRVRSKNAGGTGEWSQPVVVKTLLATPTLSGASDSDSITLNWAAITGASSYELELDGVVINVGDVTTYIHTGLNVGTQHSYKLRAISEDNNSLWTAALTRWTLPGTASISEAVSNASNSITLKWAAVTGSSGYDVEVNGAVSSVNNTTLTRTGLTANTEYTVRVRSKNAGGVGEWSQPVVVKTLLTTPVLSGASSSDAITLNWSAIAGATSYELELDGTVIAVGDEVSYTHSGLAAGTQHNYKLRALSKDNASLWTAALTRWTIPGMPVISEAVSNTSTTITVKWAAVTGTNGYDVEINGAVSSNTSTTLNKTGLTTNTDYTVRVRSKNAGGTGEWSQPVVVKTLLITPVLNGTSANDSITLNWAAITGASSYELELDGVVTNVGDVTSYTHTGLGAGTQHSYKLRALNENNNSLWTAALTRWTLPGTAAISEAVSNASNSITLKWAAVTGSSGYDVEVNGAVSSVNNTTLTRTGLTANTEYTVRVRSKNAGGVGEWSQPVVVKTLLATPVLTATATSSSITVNWAAIPGAEGYEIDFNGTIIHTEDISSYTFDGLAPNTIYKITIRSVSSDNESTWSKVLNQRTAR
ncbi:hypothetical protein D3P09_12650 [Paenibacillus pinisoli]|uniref:Fibronectin type-III domain-containing protein n=1 Tax=Paenibacillus pinisoli TaxID=1276110 RepID=A0A3A6PU00_9BACL|nr:hypothetical protein D3P09_12650 [Paenibacillus pinisoli]